MTAFEAARAVQRELEGAERAAAAALAAIPGIGTGRMGLTPDSVKSTPEYRAARAAHAAAFAELQRFNVTFQRTFRREIIEERRARRAPMQQGK